MLPAADPNPSRAAPLGGAQLQHPNIVRIHETGEQEGQPYFSMDYVEGGNLAALVREKPLPARRAAGYVKTTISRVDGPPAISRRERH